MEAGEEEAVVGKSALLAAEWATFPVNVPTVDAATYVDKAVISQETVKATTVSQMYVTGKKVRCMLGTMGHQQPA